MPEDVVLLHGFTQTGASWAPVARALGERYRAVAPDLRGHGRASELRPVSFDAVAGDLDGIVPAAGVEMAGYSMGGRIALDYALRRPERVRRLVLVGASPGLADPVQRAVRRRADAELAERIEAIGVEAFAREWGAQPLFSGQPPAVAAAVATDRRRNTAPGLAAALRGLGTGAMEPLWSRLPALEIPVVLVTGECDEKFRAIAARMATALPRAELVVVPGAGHATHLERPDAVSGALLRP